MSYGELKIDTITFTAGGVDSSVSVSGLVQNPTFTGDITTTGTVTASFVEASNTISGAVITGGEAGFGTITGDTAGFTTVTGTTVTGTTANFVTVSGTTVTGTTANFVTVSGTTVTGDTGQFTNITGVNIVGTTQVSGATVTGDVGLFGTITGGIHTLTSGVFASGTAANPSITFVDDLNTGLFTGAANTVSMVASGAAVLTVSGTNVGIGTTSPAFLLEVEGTGDDSAVISISETGTGNPFLFTQSTTENLIKSDSALPVVIQSRSTEDIVFKRGSLENARIDSSGRLLVGTPSTSSVSSLVAEGSSGSNHAIIYLARDDAPPSSTSLLGSLNWSANNHSSAAAIDCRRDSGTWTNGSSQPTALLFSTTADGDNIATERLRIDSSGKLLVGTSTAIGVGGINGVVQLEGTQAIRSTLSVLRHGDGTQGAFIVLGKTRGTSIGATTVVQNGDMLGEIRFAGADGSDIDSQAGTIECRVDGTAGSNEMPGRIMFSTNSGATSTDPVERMRITSDGELLVGYTSDNGNYKLQVNSQIFATSATIATSDGRYKENVASLGGCLDLVKALRPVSFTWKPQEDITRIDDEGNEVLVREGHNFPEGTQVGFIAQEVQEVLDGKPWLSSVIKENVRPAVKDNEGNELAPEERFYGIAEGNLIAVLTNALQEAVGRIETLEAEVAALEGN